MNKSILGVALATAFVFAPNLSANVEHSASTAVKALEQNKKLAKLNLNTVSYEQLVKVPGIGKSRAKAVIAYIEKNGKLDSFEQLKSVKGIGKGTLNKLKQNFVIE
ncbi:competence protein [Catenovulum agarivorans DS-2]|uniref:Competence protein n=1 Tax=Catenovulum agarivorans DS-2 TaxID=1328313 RepID=W7QCQ3_9ALTE|nr:helix-hairpin-helix domain-containing protein [Catenovulum agarivorans]EWH09691.1 competence protein [Catenovulum agarivorans DS-2]